MKSLKSSTKLKAKVKKVKLEKDELIAKLDKANNLNENLKNHFSSQVDKIKSLEVQLVESKTDIEKLTSSKLIVEQNSKEKYFYIPPFKRNNEELKANIARIDKGKKSDVDSEISKPMSKTPPRFNKNLKLSPFVIIVILLVILSQIVPSEGFCQPPRLDLLLGSLVVLKLLMFVTIVVLSVTLTLIVSSCVLISECLIGLILCLKTHTCNVPVKVKKKKKKRERVRYFSVTRAYPTYPTTHFLFFLFLFLLYTHLYHSLILSHRYLHTTISTIKRKKKMGPRRIFPPLFFLSSVFSLQN